MLTIMLSALLTASEIPSDPVAIRNDFVLRVERCGREPPFVPDLQARTTRAMILYDADARTVVYPVWATLSEVQKAQLLSTADGGREDGERLFTDIFQRLLVAHELGHWLEMLEDRHISHWDSELQANRVMIAYWRAVTHDDAAVEARVSRLWAVLDHQPNPVPPGHAVSDWFNTVPFDPATYGWYQGVMVREAWDRRDETDFCALVEQAWPRSAA